MDRVKSSMQQVPNAIPKVIRRTGGANSLETERENFERVQVGGGHSWSRGGGGIRPARTGGRIHGPRLDKQTSPSRCVKKARTCRDFLRHICRPTTGGVLPPFFSHMLVLTEQRKGKQRSLGNVGRWRVERTELSLICCLNQLHHT